MKGISVFATSVGLFLVLSGIPTSSAHDPTGETHVPEGCERAVDGGPTLAAACVDPDPNGAYACALLSTGVLPDGVCLHIHAGSVWYCEGEVDEVYFEYTMHSCWAFRQDDVEDTVEELKEDLPPIPQITCLPPEGICIEDGDRAAGAGPLEGGIAVPASSHPPEGALGDCMVVYVDYASVTRGPYHACALVILERSSSEDTLGVCVSHHHPPPGISQGVCTFGHFRPGSTQVCSGLYGYSRSDETWYAGTVVCT